MLKKYLDKIRIEAGCDEAGRGCLAGPVFAAAVILPKKFKNDLLNDSKKLTDKQRKYLRPLIEDKAITHAVAQVSVEEIDRINILHASFLAMHRAIDQLKVIPESLLIDGNRFNKYQEIPHTCIIEGDGKFLSIAAASILAKTYRDDYMDELHLQFPHYEWCTNRAYATEKHRAAIQLHGTTEHHRKSFRLFANQTELSFDEIDMQEIMDTLENPLMQQTLMDQSIPAAI
jgi:ribonuclease HII